MSIITREGLKSSQTYPLTGGVLPTNPITLVYELPYAVAPDTLTVDPGTSTLTVQISNNGTVMTGGSITASGSMVVGTITAPGICMIGSSLTLLFTDVTGTPNGFIEFGYTYASP